VLAPLPPNHFFAVGGEKRQKKRFMATTMPSAAVEEGALLAAAHLASRALVLARRPRRPDDTQWIVVHAASNVRCAALCVRALGDAGVPRRRPLLVVLLTHAYHALLYRPLRAEDALHHLVFMPLLVVPGVAWDWGDAACLSTLFLNGVPGALLYASVAWHRLAHTRPRAEPRLTAAVNLLLRAPGAYYAIYRLLRDLPPSVPFPLVVVQVAFSALNATYYAAQAAARWWRWERGG